CGHLFNGLASVARNGMGVKFAANVLRRDQCRQFALCGIFDLIATLAKLGLDETQAQLTVDGRFGRIAVVRCGERFQATALTRAERQVILVGDLAVLRLALKRPWTSENRRVGFTWPLYILTDENLPARCCSGSC